MNGLKKNESGISAPGSIDQKNKASSAEILESNKTAETQKQEVRRMTKDYSENLDTLLETVTTDETVKKQLRELLSHPWLKTEIIRSASQMKGSEHKLESTLKHVIENRDDISAQLAEKQKALKSFNGRLGYWRGKLEKIKGSGDALTKELKAIGDREKLLVKQISHLEKTPLDLKIPLTGGEVISFPKEASSKLKPDSIPNTPTPKETNQDDEEAEDLPEIAIDTTNEEVTRKYKMVRESDTIKPPPIPEPAKELIQETKITPTLLSDALEPSVEKAPNAFTAPLIQREVEDHTPKTESTLERRANVGGVQMEVKMVGANYVIEFPEKGMNIEIGADRAKAEQMFNLVMQDAGTLKDKTNITPLLDKIAFVIAREQSLSAAKAKEEKKTEIPPIEVTETQPEVTSEETREQAPEHKTLTDPPPETRDYLKEAVDRTVALNRSAKEDQEWSIKSGAELFEQAWNAYDETIGGTAATENTLLAAGMPENILKKYKTPQAIYAFTAKPGFWATLNGNAERTVTAINHFMERAKKAIKERS